jgi:tetratricopeptide (TPR) repeat protein
MDERRAAQQAITAWREVDEQADAAIRDLLDDPVAGSPGFAARLNAAARRPDAPPALAAVVSGGLVEKIVQIAQARDVHILVQPGNDVGGRGDERRDDPQRLLELRLAADGGPPRVADVDCYSIGVSRSKYAGGEQPYAARRIDADLRAAVREKPFVVLVGLSKTGKSRTLFEALRAELPRARLIVPRGDPAAPTKLLRHRSLLRDPAGADERVVIWLDDIDRYLAPSGLDLLTLDEYADLDPSVLIVGTIRSKRRDDVLAAPGEVGRSAQLVLGRAHTITLPRRLTPDEREAATVLYRDEDFTQRGIGEQLVAAPLLEQRYQDAYESNPAGWAVIQAAIDWRRVGLESPLTRPVIRELFSSYLVSAAPDLDPTDDTFQLGLAWARQPVAGSVALLHARHGDDELTFAAFDYILAYVDGQRPEDPVDVPRSTWHFAIRHGSPADLLDIGVAAVTRNENAVADEALRRALGADDPEVAAWGALILGSLEAERGNWERGRALLTQALESNIPDVLPVAQADLGVVLFNAGDLDRGRELLEAAVESGDPRVHALARANLGGQLLNLGEYDRSRELLEAAIDTGEPRAVALAQANLGGLLLTLGEYDRARELLEAALTSDEPNFVALASANLGALLFNTGEVERARELLETALNAAEPRVVALARANLGGLLRNLGQYDRSRELLEAALTSTEPRVVALAQATLGGLLSNLGEYDRARELLEAALASAEPRVVGMAQAGLGTLLLRAGKLEGGEALMKAALASPDPQVVTLTQIVWGALLTDAGRYDEAHPLLERAAGSADPHLRPRAMHLLANLLTSRGDVAAAAAAYQAAIDTGHALWAPTAQIDFGVLLLGAGEPERGRALLETAVGSDNPLVAASARANLGGFLVNTGELARARDLLEATVHAQDPRVAGLAQANLGGLLLNAGEPERARELLEQAVVSGDLRVVALAQANLGGLLLKQGEVERARELLEAAATAAAGPVAALARLNLGGLLFDAGELDRSIGLLEAALGSGVPHVELMARVALGSALFTAGEHERGEELLVAALDSPKPEIALLARVNLGALLVGVGEAERARPFLEAAAGTDDPEQRPRALDFLGDARAATGDDEGAREAYRAVIDTGHPRWVPIALVDLALLVAEEDPDQAVDLLRRAAATDDPDQRARALDLLGDLLVRMGDDGGAREAYRAVIDTGHPGLAPESRITLAMLVAADDPDQAVDLLQAVAAGDDPDHRPRALDLLGDVLVHRGDGPAARAAYQAAIDTGHPAWASIARIDLALLALERDRDEAIELLRVVAVDPAQGALANGLIGDVLLEGDDPAGAEGAYREAYARAPAGGTVAEVALDRLDRLTDETASFTVDDWFG